ncbi:hypothetical protein SNEBB_011308 [Seison nebaliae]|nr:hypothetical protein SNEBB_011308 [Seison nebaliae]
MLRWRNFGLKTCSLCRQLSSGMRKFPSNIALNDNQKKTIKYEIPVMNVNELDDVFPSSDNSSNDLIVVNRIDISQIYRLMLSFGKSKIIMEMAERDGINGEIYSKTMQSFRQLCMKNMKTLPLGLQVILSDLYQSNRSVDDIDFSSIYPFFAQYTKRCYPHLDCLDDLEKISDIREPTRWYSEARNLKRKIIYHAGPTNSGKTYSALQRYIESRSGIYCAPLKLLASEVCEKTNDANVPCDLITGDERRYKKSIDEPSNHICCTIEMTTLNEMFDIAIIDEIQMLKDGQRGWAWTRALLGLCAHEIHVCGESSCIGLVERITKLCGDELEVNEYERLTSLTMEEKSVDSFDNVKKGDCIVCFSKSDIFYVSRQLESLGHDVAVIYGSLPPQTKTSQAKKFNDINSTTDFMVATDAVGMGLNLNIKRIIFYSLVKPNILENGERQLDIISTSQALQIGGRAGRYGTNYSDGTVTTFYGKDLKKLKELFSGTIDEVKSAGLHPTAEQIELFAYHLPNHSLANLMDIFVALCRMDDSLYFMCSIDDFKFLANMLEHVPLSLKHRYIFSCAPINRRATHLCTMLLKFARFVSNGEMVECSWLVTQLNILDKKKKNFSFKFHEEENEISLINNQNIDRLDMSNNPVIVPSNITELINAESAFDVLDLYLWLAYRFPDMFPDVMMARCHRKYLDDSINKGVENIIRLMQNKQTVTSRRHHRSTSINTSQSTRKGKRLKHEILSMANAFQLAQQKKKNSRSHLLSNPSNSSLEIDNNNNNEATMLKELLKKGILKKKHLKQLKKELEDLEKKDK